MSHRARRLVFALLSAALAAPALAGSSAGSLQVSATVASACTVSGSVLNFGNAIDPLTAGVPVDAASTLSVQCTNTTPFAVALDAGTNAGGSTNFGARSMKNGASALGYQLYLNAGRTTVWGDGSGGSSVSSGVGTGSSQSLTIFGRLPSLSGVVPGSYVDTVTVTITY